MTVIEAYYLKNDKHWQKASDIISEHFPRDEQSFSLNDAVRVNKRNMSICGSVNNIFSKTTSYA